MKTLTRQYIEKLEEYIELLEDHTTPHKGLRKEIAQLKQQVEEEGKPEFDKAYLDECIEKAAPNLSKIKDVDKTLDEIRGIKDDEKTVSDEEIKKEIVRLTIMVEEKGMSVLGALMTFRDKLLNK